MPTPPCVPTYSAHEPNTIITHSILDVCTYAMVCRSKGKGKGKGKNKGKGKAALKWNPVNWRWEQE